MELYLATDSGRLQQAMACTAQLAHMSYRIGPDGTLLASPLPDTLRGGLLMLSDEGGTYPDAPEGLCRQLLLFPAYVSHLLSGDAIPWHLYPIYSKHVTTPGQNCW